MKKIIIADDHELIIDGLCALFSTQSDIEVIATANNGRELLSLVRQSTEIDVLIVDINMPEVDGIEVTRTLKQEYPEIKILILSMYNRAEFVRSLIKVGADGYVLKNAGHNSLLEAINTIHQGQQYFEQAVLDSINETEIETRATKDMSIVELSDREKEVVRLIAQEKSTSQIADELFLSTHTINSHRKSILNKLDVKNAAGIFRYALQSGIVKGFDL